ncbi:diphthamide biosynthesis 4 [Pyrenophora seminiperda CCB06]|uniref:Diphthamide biosynthesis protein 4 n=1 Tax=Pyrenophora seminiperda CCB06 TaxID=1302712 RepID=A0A3M7MHG3_9PLEO|nr:diphthamide biosynthesis 4 [Pyrenophora seminiperda CCB06]
MAYTKDFYRVLGLDAPRWNDSAKAQSAADLRRGYKTALLAAHPDKRGNGTTDAAKMTEGDWYTVDDVREAYIVLADPKTRADYDNWLLHNRDALCSSWSSQSASLPSSDFILGLELVDLSDFDVVDTVSDLDTKVDSAKGHVGQEGGKQMQWTRACRCGTDHGFRILEEELEDAEERGEKEVLVGCEGCSLWVRVGFAVEVG